MGNTLCELVGWRQAPQEESERIKRGERVKLNASKGIHNFPQQKNPLIEIRNFPCDKIPVLGAMTIVINDESCPSGMRIYNLNDIIVLGLFTNSGNCEQIISLDKDWDFINYCI